MADNKIDIAIGERLSSLIGILKSHNITNSEGKMNSGVFAESVGIDPSQFSKMKNGEVGITLEKIMEISSRYNVSIEWLITGKGEAIMSEEGFAISEGDTGHKKSGTSPDSFARILNDEITAMRSSLDKLSLAASVIFGSELKLAAPYEDLPLGKKNGASKKKGNSGNR